jgi:hypothetical protein
MDGTSSITAIDQKMAEMRIKNLELLKRHQVCTWLHTNYLCGGCIIVDDKRVREKGERIRETDDWYLSTKRSILSLVYVLECHCNEGEKFLLTILFLPFRRLLSPLTGEYAFVQNEGYRVSIDGARARSASVTIVTICLE